MRTATTAGGTILSFFLLPVLLVGLIGASLGIAAFVRVHRLQAELHDLRRRLDQPAGPLPEPSPMLLPTSLPAPPPARRKPRHDIEALLTLQWGMWLGGAALLLSGVFLVRYAATEGWLTAPVRCAGLELLGLLLIVLAETLRRRTGRGAADGRALPDLAPAALAGGGVSMLLAGAYAVGSIYRLVPPAVGFGLIASASFAALALSLRFGRLVAAIGIAGAFATPALAQDGQASLPMLFGYLLLVSLAGLGVQRRTGWTFIGWATLLAGAAWTACAGISAGAAEQWPGFWAPSLFAPVSAGLHLAALSANRLGQAGRGPARRALAAIGMPEGALLLLALATGSPATAAGLLLMAPIAVFASRNNKGGGLAWLAAAGPLLLLAVWTQPGWLGHELATGPLVPDLAMLAASGLGLAGWWIERHDARPLAWTALPAALPLLTLAVWHLQPSLPHRLPGVLPWIGTALLPGIVLAGRAWSLRSAPQRAGILAAGVAASCALAAAWMLDALGVPFSGLIGLAPLLPVLAVIASRTELAPLRSVALAPALLLPAWPLVALAAEPALLSDRTALSARLPALLVSTLCAALAARVFARPGRRDVLDRLLDAGATLLAVLLSAAAVRSLAGTGQPVPGFVEGSLQDAALWLEALAWLAMVRRPGPVPGDAPWQAIGVLALAGSLLLIPVSPLLRPEPVGTLPLLDALLPAYAIPAFAALSAARWRAGTALARWLSRFALLSGFVWLSLEVRHLFHPGGMALQTAPVGEIELWALSGVWLGLGAALMASGLAARRPGLRRAGLLMLGLTTLKVLLVDTGGLAGIWRVLSFLALGLTLIASGAAYRRFGNETLSTPDVAALHKPEEIP